MHEAGDECCLLRTWFHMTERLQDFWGLCRGTRSSSPFNYQACLRGLSPQHPRAFCCTALLGQGKPCWPRCVVTQLKPLPAAASCCQVCHMITEAWLSCTSQPQMAASCTRHNPSACHQQALLLSAVCNDFPLVILCMVILMDKQQQQHVSSWGAVSVKLVQVHFHIHLAGSNQACCRLMLQRKVEGRAARHHRVL